MANLPETLTQTIAWLNITFGIFLFLFGIIGNCLTIYVFTRPIFRNTNSAIYLIACSIASCIQLIHTLIPRILSDRFQIDIVHSNHTYCRLRNTISAVASLCAISYPCWASFDQFNSTSRNAARRLYWSSKRFVYCAVFFTILFWFGIYLTNSVFSQASGNTCASSNLLVSLIYSYGITPVSYSILPIILFAYFNIGLVRNLRNVPANIILNTKRRMARQVHRMLLPQLFILILSGIPYSAQLWYNALTILITKDANRIAIENLITNIVRLLFYLNYVCSFYIYILMSTAFKKVVQNLY